MANELRTRMRTSSHAATHVVLDLCPLDCGLQEYMLLCRTDSLTIHETAAASPHGTAYVSSVRTTSRTSSTKTAPHGDNGETTRLESFPFWPRRFCFEVHPTFSILEDCVCLVCDDTHAFPHYMWNRGDCMILLFSVCSPSMYGCVLHSGAPLGGIPGALKPGRK